MSLTLTLNNALSSLKVNRESLAVLSQNIANANNPDYSRKVLDQSSVSLDGVGAGVSIVDVSRKVDTYLQGAILSQSTTLGRAEALNEFAERLQTLMGKPGASNSIDGYVTSFFNSMQALAETPERSTYRLNVVNSGQDLSFQLKELVRGVRELQFNADQEIAVSVSAANQALEQLHSLNAAIANASALNRPNSELLDQRDAAIQDVAKHVNLNTFFLDSGEVRIYTAGGATLLDESLYELEYAPSPSPESFKAASPLSALKIHRLSADGVRQGSPQELITGGVPSSITTKLSSGRIKALVESRDENLPDLIAQIDMLAAQIRDEVNAIHNQGSGYPGTASLTGTRSIAGGEVLNWEGSVRVGLVDSSGQPIASPYTEEANTGIRPLDINLAELNSGTGDGNGYPSMQTIINEINEHYRTPGNKVSLGNLNNIQLASNNLTMPASSFEFDFDLENISGVNSNFFATNVTVRDDTATDITAVTNTVPKLALSATNTYATTANSSDVTVTTDSLHGLKNGDVVYLPDPGGDVNGVPQAVMEGYFIIKNVTDTTFDVEFSAAATSTGTNNTASLNALTPYHESVAGDKQRTVSNGTFKADLTGNLNSEYYDVTVNVGVVQADGTVNQGALTYRVMADQGNLYNKRYDVTAATGTAQIARSKNNTQPYVRAKLVDENGTELSRVNNAYLGDQQGFLKLETNFTDTFLVVDSLNSKENGRPDASPIIQAGSDRGFSHYFELNNFFTSNAPISSGDTLTGSAENLSVSSRLIDAPGQVSTGALVLSKQPADPNADPLYTYARSIGDNSIAQKLAKLAGDLVAFDAAGGLSTSNQTLNGYAGEILGFASADANSAQSTRNSAQIIFDGFVERSSAISGVNLDEELANTIIYQNAFSASARLITITDELFGTLIDSFR